MEKRPLRVREISSPEVRENFMHVALYGTSVEELSQIIKTGLIIPMRHDLDDPHPHTELQEQGKYIYPTIANITALRVMTSHLASDLEKRSEYTDWDDEVTIGMVSGYAYRKSLISAMREYTGEYHAYGDIMIFASKILPLKDFIAFATTANASELYLVIDGKLNIDRLREINAESDKDNVRILFEQYRNDGAIRAFLKEKGKRSGVILYYGQDIFKYSHPSSEYEDEIELFFIADKPIPADIIVGIQFLSPKDREEFQALHPEITLN